MLDAPGLSPSLTSQVAVAAHPHVVRGAQVGHIGDGALAVDLPHTLQLLLNVRAALGADVNVVSVKGGTAMGNQAEVLSGM